MSYDIYGQNLRPGHCEVHPDVHMSYPCPCCMADRDHYQSRKHKENQYYRQMEEDYYTRLAGDEEYESWFPLAAAKPQGET